MELIRQDQFETLERIVRSEKDSYEAEYLEEIDFSNTSDTAIADIAEDLLQTIIIEDAKMDLFKCDRERVKETLVEWLQDWTD